MNFYFNEEDVKQAFDDLDNKKYKEDDFKTKQKGYRLNFKSKRNNKYSPRRVLECITLNKNKIYNPYYLRYNDIHRRIFKEAGFKEI